MSKAFVRLTLILAAAGALTACAHAVDLIPGDGGAPGVGDVRFRGGGMAVRVEGKRYSGRFIPASSPELAAIGASSTGPWLTGRHWGVQGARGPTGAILTAKDGSSIACRFDYDGPQMVGSGVCRGSDGRNFGLRMR